MSTSAQRVTSAWLRRCAADPFWQWMSHNYPEVPNPNRDGRQDRITPNTLKEYAEGSSPDSQRAQQMVQQYRFRYRQDQQRQQPQTPKVQDPVFHTTSFANLEDIAENGLQPRSGGGTFQHGGYAEHSQGKVFLSEHPEAARAWQSKVFDQLEDQHGDDEDDLGRRVPVMLRVKSRKTQVDPVGDKDVPGSRITTEGIGADEIEFWHPKSQQWTPVSEWESAQADLAVSERSEHGTIINDEAFMPQDEGAYDRDDGVARRQKQERQKVERQKQERARQEQERQKKEQEGAKWLEPQKRQEWIDKIKEKGAKHPFLKGGDWETPGVFPKFWQDRLKVDRDGNPLKDYPLKKAANALSDNFWGWSARRVAAAWLQHKVAKESDNFWAWMQQRHPRVPNPNPDGREREISPRTLKQYSEGGDYVQRAQDLISRYKQMYDRGRETAQSTEDRRYEHVEFEMPEDEVSRKGLAKALGTADVAEQQRRALDLAGMGYLSSLVKEVEIEFEEGPVGDTVSMWGVGDHGLKFGRNLNYRRRGNPWYVENEEFYLAPDAPDGIGTRMIAGQLEAVDRTGFEYIETIAAGNPKDPSSRLTGYYAWPRMGFDAFIANEVEKPLPDEIEHKVERLADLEGEEPMLRHLMMFPEGRDWWRENGNAVFVSMPTGPKAKDDPQRRFFAEYLEERARRAERPSKEDWLRRMAFVLSEIDEEILNQLWDKRRRALEGKKTADAGDY